MANFLEPILGTSSGYTLNGARYWEPPNCVLLQGAPIWKTLLEPLQGFPCC